METHVNDSDAFGSNVLSVALIGPHEQRRRNLANALAMSRAATVREYSAYPAELKDASRLLEHDFDAIIIDLEASPEYALELVERLAAANTATVMVYSTRVDPNLMVRAMRAGAREFLADPIDVGALSDALGRASSRRQVPGGAKETGGKLFVFLGGKGGVGVTTVACNFAVALAQDCMRNTVLIDLDLPLGDAALSLGMTPQFSAADALLNVDRLDSNFFSKLLTKHASGLSILGAPGRFPNVPASNEAIGKLLAVARRDFEFVVVDAGSRFDLTDADWFKQAEAFYVVMQAGIPELRNTHRLITEFFKAEEPKLELVLNRYMPRSLGVDEGHIEKALSRPIQWKIPSDYATVRRMQNEAVPLASEDSTIGKIIQQMARSACGMPSKQEKKKGFSLFK